MFKSRNHKVRNHRLNTVKRKANAKDHLLLVELKLRLLELGLGLKPGLLLPQW